jgi:hypothetical protein
MSGTSGFVFLNPNSTFASTGADTIVSGGADTISMFAPSALAFGFGNSADLITAYSADTIVGGLHHEPPISPAETLVTAGQGAVVWSNGGNVVVNSGGSNTIVTQQEQTGGFGNFVPPDTVFAGTGGGTYFISGSDLFVGDSTGSSTIVGVTSFIPFAPHISVVSEPVIFSGGGSVLYFSQPVAENVFTTLLGTPTFVFTAQSGDSTISTTTSQADSSTGAVNTSAGEAFVTNGGDLNLVGSGSDNQLIVGAGNETVNAAGSTGYNTFFAGSGNSSLVGGSGSDALGEADLPSAVSGFFEANLFEASGGSTTMAGGVGVNDFQFTSGYAGGSDLIQNWNGNDQLQFFGYGGNPIASQAVSGGSTLITLTDGTRITISGITNLNQAPVLSV